MSIGRGVKGLSGLGGIVSVMCSVMCSGAIASTVSADLVTPPQDLSLSDLILVDALGYDCIRETDIDLAFHAGGKGVRLPRTCLPEPCRAALTPLQLASLIGRQPFEAEWDDYVSRYSDHCRKEVVPFAGVETEPGDIIETAADFWQPLVASYPASAPIRAGFPQGGPPAPILPPPGPGDLSSWSPPPVTIFPPVPGDDPKREDPPSGGSDPVPSVPLPGGLVLWLTGIAALLLQGRRRAAALACARTSGWRPRHASLVFFYLILPLHFNWSLTK